MMDGGACRAFRLARQISMRYFLIWFIEVFSGTQTTFVVREVSTESVRLRRSRLEFLSFLRDLRRSSIRSKLRLIHS